MWRGKKAAPQLTKERNALVEKARTRIAYKSMYYMKSQAVMNGGDVINFNNPVPCDCPLLLR